MKKLLVGFLIVIGTTSSTYGEVLPFSNSHSKGVLYNVEETTTVNVEEATTVDCTISDTIRLTGLCGGSYPPIRNIREGSGAECDGAPGGIIFNVYEMVIDDCP